MTEKRFYYFGDGEDINSGVIDGDTELTLEETVGIMNELHEEVMDLGRENTKFKLTVSEIIEDMQKYVDDNQLIYINQSYVDWIKKEVDTTLYSQKRSYEE